MFLKIKIQDAKVIKIVVYLVARSIVLKLFFAIIKRNCLFLQVKYLPYETIS